MDASHIVVGGLTGITLILLVWVEIRSRRNSAIQEQTHTPPAPAATAEQGCAPGGLRKTTKHSR